MGGSARGAAAPACAARDPPPARRLRSSASFLRSAPNSTALSRGPDSIFAVPPLCSCLILRSSAAICSSSWTSSSARCRSGQRPPRPHAAAPPAAAAAVAMAVRPALGEGAAVPALGVGAFRALDAPALALEFCELPFQLLEGIALVLQLRAQDAQALVPGFDFLIEFDLGRHGRSPTPPSWTVGCSSSPLSLLERWSIACVATPVAAACAARCLFAMLAQAARTYSENIRCFWRMIRCFLDYEPKIKDGKLEAPSSGGGLCVHNVSFRI